jgi:hypothetical protein
LIDIIDHRQNPTTRPSYNSFPTGTQRVCPTCDGWDICVQWKNQSNHWIALDDMHESYPIQMAKYAQHNCLAHMAAFSWWLPQAITTHTQYLSKMKTKYWAHAHKFGIEIPTSVSAASSLDQGNGQHLWHDATAKELANVLPAFDIYDGDPQNLVGYQRINCHMIFYVKHGETF